VGLLVEAIAVRTRLEAMQFRSERGEHVANLAQTFWYAPKLI
jgi:hypothetical protein